MYEYIGNMKELRNPLILYDNREQNGKMNYNHLDEKDMKEISSMVSPDRFSNGESNLDLHSKDQSYHIPSRPEAVIWPVTEEEVAEIVRYANTRRIPVTGWGAGSSLEGNPIPVRKGLVLDFSMMNRIINIREEDFQADVEPGVVYKDLNEHLRYKGLFFPPDPGARATIGGMIANNASGTRTIKYGATKDHILRLSVILASGKKVDMGCRSSKTSSGYDLIHLFVGSEGTLGLVTRATVKLVGLPIEFSIVIAHFPSIETASRAVFEIIRSGLDPAMLELLATECIHLMNKEKDMGLTVSPSIFMEFHGPSRAYLSEIMDLALEICEDQKANDFKTGIRRDERERLISSRHELSEMIQRNHPGCSKVSIDIAVPITAYPEMISMAEREKQEANIPAYIFGHAGDGNLHFVFMPESGNEQEINIVDQVSERVVRKALSLDGTATGEHGVGIGKRKFMKEEHGTSLELMRSIKNLFDPMGIFNPGKIFL